MSNQTVYLASNVAGVTLKRGSTGGTFTLSSAYAASKKDVDSWQVVSVPSGYTFRSWKTCVSRIYSIDAATIQSACTVVHSTANPISSALIQTAGSYWDSLGYTLYGYVLLAYIERFKITFDANGGSGDVPGAVSVDSNMNWTCPSSSLTRDGHLFLGWSESSSAATATYTAGNVYTASGDTTLYAVWKAATISFSSAGTTGGSPPASITVGSSGSWSCPGAGTLIKGGHSFLGWSESSTATTPTYTAGGVYTHSGSNDFTLYSVWQKTHYIITFDANGGQNAPSPIYVSYQSTSGWDCPQTEPDWDGHSFVCWRWTSSLGTIWNIFPGDHWSAVEDMTLVALWNALQGMLIFNANGGTLSEKVRTMTYGQAYGVLPTPTRSGYSFDGWYTAASGGTQVTSATTFTSGYVVIYAHWTSNTTMLLLYFDANGGECSPTYKEITAGSAYGELPEPTRSRYTFAGWYTAASGGSRVTSATVAGSASTTVYAHWAADSTCIITFNASGGSSSESSRTVSVNKAIGPLPVPTRSGYVFEGWFTSASGGTQVFESTAFSSATTVYAQWGTGTATNIIIVEAI